MDALRFIVSSLLWLVIFAFLLRVILQFARADFRNPISQAIVRITNPLVLPLRRIVPPIGKVDLASIVALLLVELAAITIKFWLSGVVPSPTLALVAGATDLARNILQFYVVAIIIYIVLSWVAPGTYSPAASLLSSICDPVLNPVRRLIPPIAGFDLSGLFVLIGLQALLILLR